VSWWSAIVEDEQAKVQTFRQLDELLPYEVVLASNTSSIPIAELAAATERADRVLGLHFFSPVPVIKLVEVVIGLDSSPETVQRAEAFASQIGKTPINTKDRSGFIVNFLLVPDLMAAVRMYEEGFASREDIDEGMKLGCGHPMGPLQLCDFIGLDVLYSVCDSLCEEFKRDEYAPPPLMKRMVVAGHLGRKAGHGFSSTAERGCLRNPPARSVCRPGVRVRSNRPGPLAPRRDARSRSNEVQAVVRGGPFARCARARGAPRRRPPPRRLADGGRRREPQAQRHRER
jgi:3-hydroxyacyl-CoA dehydrogenase